MKKFIKALLIVVLFFTLLPFFHELHEDEDHNHEHEEIFHVHVVHALAPGDDVGECTAPGCVGGRMKIVDLINNVTCTSDGYFLAMCNNCGYSEYRTPPALGHNPVATITIPATCTASGSQLLTCGRCGANLGNSTIPALGHDLKTVTTKYPTCTESGLENTHCTRCSDEYNTIKAPLGHDWKESIVDPTCTEDGYYSRKCNRCNEEEKEILKALGHDVKEFKTIKEPTCTEDGLKKAVCERCREEVEEKVPKLGHSYPEEWTTEKEAGFFSEGLKSKSCKTCHEKTEEKIPEKDKTPVYVAGAGSAIALGVLGFVFMKKNAARAGVKIAKEIIEEGTGLGKPSIEDKSILVSSKNEKLIDLLKSRSYLKVSTCDYENVVESTTEEEPDALLCSIDSTEQLNEVLNYKKEDLKDYEIGLIIKQSVIDENKEVLDQLVKDGEIINYISEDKKEYNVLVKLVTPILKPNLKSDETLENIGMLADVLGVPGISTAIDVFINGRDIKATLENEELELTDKATIIADLAYILGFDTVGDVVDLVNDMSDIKSTINKEAGAYELKKGVSSAKNIAEVVSDVISKD